MEQAYCPHCLERLPVPAADEASLTICPVCERALDAADDATPKDYQANAPDVEPAKQKEVKEYVQFLEARARKELDKKPYDRRPPRVNLYSGLILIGIGVAILVRAILSDDGMMALLINGILFSCVFFMCGAACLMFHGKSP